MGAQNDIAATPPQGCLDPDMLHEIADALITNQACWYDSPADFRAGVLALVQALTGSAATNVAAHGSSN